MTATEELRRMLDERGVKHNDEYVKSCIPYCDGYEETYWGNDSFEYIEPIRPKPNTLGSHPELTINNCTAAKAVEVTLGREKCRYESVNQCINLESGAVYGFEHALTCGHSFISARNTHVKFCPECGREVEQ